MAASRVLVYENQRGWRYYWCEGDAFAHLLRTQFIQDLRTECAALATTGAPPRGSISCRWTPELFDESDAHLVASYDPARGELRYSR